MNKPLHTESRNGHSRHNGYAGRGSHGAGKYPRGGWESRPPEEPTGIGLKFFALLALVSLLGMSLVLADTERRYRVASATAEVAEETGQVEKLAGLPPTLSSSPTAQDHLAQPATAESAADTLAGERVAPAPQAVPDRLPPVSSPTFIVPSPSATPAEEPHPVQPGALAPDTDVPGSSTIAPPANELPTPTVTLPPAARLHGEGPTGSTSDVIEEPSVTDASPPPQDDPAVASSADEPTEVPQVPTATPAPPIAATGVDEPTTSGRAASPRMDVETRAATAPTVAPTSTPPAPPPSPTATEVPPTETRPAATATSAPPTESPVMLPTETPTETPVPATETPVVPAETALPPAETVVLPTETPLPPTEAPLPTETPTVVESPVPEEPTPGAEETNPLPEPTATLEPGPMRAPDAVAPGNELGGVPEPTSTLASLPHEAVPEETESAQVADILAQVAANERALEKGHFDVVIRDALGQDTQVAIDFNLGKGEQQPGRIRIKTTHPADPGQKAVDRLTVGGKSWQREAEGPWTPLDADRDAQSLLQGYLPGADRTTRAELQEAGDALVLEWQDTARNAEISLVVDPVNYIPRQLQMTTLSTGELLIVVYERWNGTADIPDTPAWQ